MTFLFIYDLDYPRTIPAILIDSRATIDAIKNKIGTIIKQYTDAQVALVGVNTLPYKIETNNGNLAGYFTLEVNKVDNSVSLGQFVPRPAFIQFLSQIQQQIGNFIFVSGYIGDYLPN